MIETITAQSGEIVSLEEAKRELGVWDSADDGRVRLLLEAARGYCEEWGEITLRLAATRTIACETWPASGWLLRRPPVLAVTAITYYDTSDQQQTLASSAYRTHGTAAGLMLVEIKSDAQRPGLTDRADAVTVTYTTGWGTADAAPADLKAAILLTMKHLFGEDDTKDLGYARAAAQRLLTGRAASTYA